MEIKPGFYPDVPFDEYASWDAVNHSRLTGFKDTPAHAHELFISEPKRTPALEFGWLAHLAVLEPKRLWEEACVRPAGDGRTKEVKPKLEAFRESLRLGGANYGKTVIAVDQEQKLRAMTRAVREHETAREYLLGKGFNELSIVWRDEDTAVLCKARLDRVAVASKMPGVLPDRLPASKQFMLICDVKTHDESASLDSFQRAIYKYDYGTAAAMYTEGLNVVHPTNEPRPFVWIVIEKEPPHAVRIFTPTDDLLDWGGRRWHGWLEKYKECESSGVWPAWEAGVSEAGLPAWAQKRWEDTL